ncbi:hypothetical protein BDF14DRAFT_1824588 [Spinellus fusiger]|nr:hypothetical protein BDF14DRAFT_1824588 [Spinellus fusiger]
MTSQEKTVQNSCPDVSVRRIRTLLRKYKGDPDKVIDFLYEAMYQEEEKKEETEAQMDEPKNKEENKDISKESAGPTLSQPLETDTLNDTPTQDQKTHDPVILDSKPAPPTTETVAEEEPALMKSQTKVKRKSAHQRKQEAKLLQKAQRLEKKRGSAKASGSTETETSQDPDGLSKPMKQLCI